MTIQEINDKRRDGDILTVSKLSGIPLRTIQNVLYNKVKPSTKRAIQVINWFSTFLECRENIKIKEDLTNGKK